MDTRRIRKHTHADDNSGGRLDGQAAVFTSGGASSGGGGSTTAGLDAADVLALGYFELVIEGGQSTIYAHGTTGATETIDPTDGNVHTLTLDAACTITLNAPSGSGFCSLECWVTENGTGGYGITWPGSVTEEGTHTTTAGTTQRVILETIDGGTSWIATWIGSSAGATDLDDLTDVTITTPATADRLRYNGSAWVNSALKWVPTTTYNGTNWLVAVDGSGNAIMTEA